MRWKRRIENHMPAARSVHKLPQRRDLVPVFNLSTTTTMATEAQSPPQFTIFNRVASIPIVSDSLATIQSTLANNAYTRTPFSMAQALTTRAYTMSEPLQIRLIRQA